MSNKGIIILALSLFAAFPAFAQQFTVNFDFTVTIGGETPPDAKGKALIQDECYHIESPVYEIWCDGESRWIIDKDAREVTVETDEPLGDLLQNIDIEWNGNEPSGAYFTLEDGTVVRISVQNFKQTNPVNLLFRYDTSRLGDDYIVTDLR